MILKTKTKNNKKILSLAMIICYALILNMMIFSVGISQAAVDANGCDDTLQSCASGSTTTTKKTTPQPTTLEKQAKTLEEANANYAEAVASIDDQIEQRKTAIKEAEASGDTAKVTALNSQISNLEASKQTSVAYKEQQKAKAAYDKTASTQANKAQTAYDKAAQTTATKKAVVDGLDKQIQEKQDEIASTSDPAVQTQKQKELDALRTKKEKADADYSKAQADEKTKKQTLDSANLTTTKYDEPTTQAGTSKPKDQLSDPTVPRPYISNPNTSQSFNVDDYLTISNEHGTYFNDGEHSSAVNFIIRVINIMVRIIGSVAMLILIIGGLILITAHGSEPMLEKGKDTIKYGLIGLVIALSSALIITFINNFLSVGTTG